MMQPGTKTRNPRYKQGEGMVQSSIESFDDEDLRRNQGMEFAAIECQNSFQALIADWQRRRTVFIDDYRPGSALQSHWF